MVAQSRWRLRGGNVMKDATRRRRVGKSRGGGVEGGPGGGDL